MYFLISIFGTSHSDIAQAYGKLMNMMSYCRFRWSLQNLQSVRRDFIIPVNRERREMVGNIILSFTTLASAFRLKAPLPPYLPPAEQSRQRLVSHYISLLRRINE
jgi:hypothetical protein